MDRNTYRVAILGCRGRGRATALAYHDHPRTKIVGLCDLVEGRVDALGQQVDVNERFTNLNEMIDQTSPDIVAIPTGTEFHHGLCMAVLEHGVHIEVEKPMCIDLVQADDVISKAELQGSKVAVHHQGRVSPAMQTLQYAVDEGKIGNIRYIYGSGKGYYGGYGLMNIGTHMINNMLRFGGSCRSVVAQATTKGQPITPQDVVPSPSGMGTIACEHLTATLQFDNDVTATLLQHRFDKMDTSAYVMEIYGSEGRLFWKGNNAWWLPQPHYLPSGQQWEVLDLVFPDHYKSDNQSDPSDYCFVDDYVRALDEDDEHECSGYQGRHVLEIMMGIFESATGGRRVVLPQQDRDHPLLRWRDEVGLGDLEPLPRDYGNWLSTQVD
tara:strand:- start:767 stop:1909 length:1143 start_codon:yes stop_codon:yes gene_type:complete